MEIRSTASLEVQSSTFKIFFVEEGGGKKRKIAAALGKYLTASPRVCRETLLHPAVDHFPLGLFTKKKKKKKKSHLAFSEPRLIGPFRRSFSLGHPLLPP